MAKHSANIEMIHFKTARQWKGLLSPLLRNYLDELAPGPTYCEGDVIGWSLNLQKNGHQRTSSDGGVLLAKLITSFNPEGQKRTLLSILCISIGGECNKYEIGSLFLEHITNFSKTMSWDGFHIGCPNSGSYSQFIHSLTRNTGHWMKYPGKIVVTLSNLKKVGPLLKRLERSTKRMHQPAKWSIEPYSMNELDQWKERIKEFLPDAKIGRLQSSIIHIEGYDIVIGMLQSISMIEYNETIFQDFGLVIYDECHHLGAETFSRALLKTGTKYTLGLSATPKRLDGLSKVFEWYLGDIVYNIKKRDEDNVNVKMIIYSNSDPKYSKEIVNFKVQY